MYDYYVTLKMKNAFSVLLTHTRSHRVKMEFILNVFTGLMKKEMSSRVTASDNTIIHCKDIVLMRVNENL